MRTWRRGGLAVLTACVVALGTGRAADEKEITPADAPATPDRGRRLYDSLRDVINRGADLYNGGDMAGCYRLYEGALLGLRPYLDGRPELQKAITDALAEAERTASMVQRPFVLRKALDQVRAAYRPAGAPAKAPVTRVEKKPAPPKTLWERLGGEKGVAKLVDDLIDKVSHDPAVNLTRDGKKPLTPEEVKALRTGLIQQVSEIGGGPLKYNGKSMKEVHKGMHITEAQFNAFIKDVRAVLSDYNVQAADAKTLLDELESTRKAVVQPAEEKKPETKPAPAKPEKKPEGKKPAEKKKSAQETEAGAEVKGVVTLDGKPLAGGTLTLLGAGGKRHAATITDGAYDLKGVSPGSYRIMVKGKDARTGVPARYADVGSSPITVEVHAGSQTQDLNLLNP